MNIKMPTEKITYKFHNLITNTIEIEFLVKKKFGPCDSFINQLTQSEILVPWEEKGCRTELN